MSQKNLLFRCVALALFFSVSLVGASADDPIGSWDLTAEFPNRTAEMKLTVSGDGDDLTGKIDGPRGAQDVENVSFADGELKFEMTINAQGQEFGLGFSGKIDDDYLEGSFETDFGAFPVTGERVVESVPVAGTWNLTVDSELGSNARTLVINDDLSGTYGGGDFESFAVSDVNVDGNKVTMNVTLSVQGLELPSKISLTLDGDRVDGTLDYGQGEATITGTRSKETIAGTWTLELLVPGQGSKLQTVIFEQEGDSVSGKYDAASTIFEVKNIKFNDGKISFDVPMEQYGFTGKFEGTVEGDKAKGTAALGDDEYEWTAQRESK